MGIIYIFTLGILGFGWIFDKSFVKSLRENYCGFDLRYFETLETKTNGTYFVGGNSRTLAFRETVKYLSEHTGIKYSHTKRI